MMRVVVLSFLLLALAGCTDSPGDTVDPDDAQVDPTGTAGTGEGPSGDGSGDDVDPGSDPDMVQTEENTEVVSGTLTWHSQETQGIWMPVTLAAQPVFNECVSSADGTVWITNLDLRTAEVSGPVPEGTVGLEVLFEWSSTDFAGERLVLAYAPVPDGGVVESDWIPKGEVTRIDLDGDDPGGDWGLWACVSKAGRTTNTDPGEGPKPFIGDLTFVVSAIH